MNGGVRVRGALALVFLLAHFTLRPVLLEWPVAPSFLFGGLLLAVLRLRAGAAAALGFGLGILEAALALQGMGVLSILLTAIGFLGARSRDLLFADARPFVFLYLAAGTWVGLFAAGLALGSGGPGDLLLPSLASAALTSLVCGTAERLATAVWR